MSLAFTNTASTRSTLVTLITKWSAKQLYQVRTQKATVLGVILCTPILQTNFKRPFSSLGPTWMGFIVTKAMHDSTHLRCFTSENPLNYVMMSQESHDNYACSSLKHKFKQKILDPTGTAFNNHRDSNFLTAITKLTDDWL